MDEQLKNSIKALKAWADGDKSQVEIDHDVVPSMPRYGAKDVKRIRKHLSKALHRRITQKIFSLIVGASQRTIESWEAGQAYPSGGTCRLLEQLYLHPQLAYWCLEGKYYQASSKARVYKLKPSADDLIQNATDTDKPVKVMNSKHNQGAYLISYHQYQELKAVPRAERVLKGLRQLLNDNDK